MNNPLVSVIIPSYNYEQFVEEAILSVVNQTYKNIELIVIDDGSTDGSVTLINKLKEKYDFTFIYRENKGLASTLNEGIALVSGEFFCFCSSDDAFYTGRISEQLEAMQKNKAVVSYGKATVFDDNGNFLLKQTEAYNKNLEGGSIFEKLLTFRFTPPVTFMYETSFFLENIVKFNSELAAEDYDISLTISRKTNILFIDSFLYNYRSPLLIGSNRKRPIRIDVSESHFQSIQRFQDHPLYHEAILEWNYRRFIRYSGLVGGKIYAIKGMIGSFSKCMSWYYIKGFVRLCIQWKK